MGDDEKMTAAEALLAVWPRTADGVLVWPGMHLLSGNGASCRVGHVEFNLHESEHGIREPGPCAEETVARGHWWRVYDTGGVRLGVWECYSTRPVRPRDNQQSKTEGTAALVMGLTA